MEESNTQKQQEADIKAQFEADLTAFALRYGVDRLKIESANFIRDYRRGEDGGIFLKQEKAVIRAFGQIRRVEIGEHAEYKTFEEADEGIRAAMSEYYRKRRETRTDKQREGERRRQKTYRARQQLKRGELRQHEEAIRRRQ